MACARKRGNWKSEHLEMAITEVQEGNISVRKASEKYGVPKSTIYDHASLKVKEVTSRPGPSPVLKKEEEEELVQWTIKMAEVGYGQCKQQVCIMVKKLLDENGRPNPFTDNYPGKDWWNAFLKRHPEIRLRTPQAIETYRAKACTPSVMNKWYTDYEQFLLVHNLIDKPHNIWNCDESGFSFCPKSGKVLAPYGTKTVYHVSSGKGQITTLVCISAAGGIIPPMHVFPGVRFSYNPMEGCIEGAYFGKSENGWMTQELFYGWITKHFMRHITAERPVCLLVDGHTSHIDLQTAKFCNENHILLYCLPPHSSHITQPLDVGFFSPLKGAWKKAVIAYNCDHPGAAVNKSTFAKVFRKAYLQVVKPESIMNAFKHSGIYPPNRKAIDERKLHPSQVYQQQEKAEPYQPIAAKKLALTALEEELEQDVLKKYECRWEEEYDCKDDPLYSTWKKLKEQCSRVPLGDLSNRKVAEPRVTDSELFKVPTVARVEKPSKSIRGTACLPKHISGNEVIKILEEQKAKKEMEEKMKEERQQQREERKKEKELEKARKKEEQQRQREDRRKKKEIQEKEKEERRKRRKKGKEQQKKSEKSSDETECKCPICKVVYTEDSEISEVWIECELCGQWYHLECTTLQVDDVTEDIDFICRECI